MEILYYSIYNSVLFILKSFLFDGMIDTTATVNSWSYSETKK